LLICIMKDLDETLQLTQCPLCVVTVLYNCLWRHGKKQERVAKPITAPTMFAAGHRKLLQLTRR